LGAITFKFPAGQDEEFGKKRKIVHATRHGIRRFM